MGRCQQCGGPLRDSPSDDWCDEPCQRRWMQKRHATVPLPRHEPAGVQLHPPVPSGYRGMTLARLLGLT